MPRKLINFIYKSWLKKIAIISIHVQQPIGLGAELDIISEDVYFQPSAYSPLPRKCEDIREGSFARGLAGQK